MKKIQFLRGIVLTIVFLFALPRGGVQTVVAQEYEVPELTHKYYEGRKKFVDQYGDEVWMYYFTGVTIYPKLKFDNKKQEEYFWRTVRDVRKTLPYAKKAFNALVETYEYIQTIPDPKERERHLKTLEKDIVAQYKPAIMKMTKTQGKILLKLVNRETEQSGYNIVKAFLGSLRAAFWQTFGSFFGMNMKAGFHPESNHDDAIIERIATEIEQGTL